MATSNSSSLCKTEVYEALYLISQATQQIIDNLDRLLDAKVLGGISAEINKTIALQLRAELQLRQSTTSPARKSMQPTGTRSNVNACSASKPKPNPNEIGRRSGQFEFQKPVRHPEGPLARKRGWIGRTLRLAINQKGAEVR